MAVACLSYCYSVFYHQIFGLKDFLFSPKIFLHNPCFLFGNESNIIQLTICKRLLKYVPDPDKRSQKLAEQVAVARAYAKKVRNQLIRVSIVGSVLSHIKSTNCIIAKNFIPEILWQSHLFNRR